MMRYFIVALVVSLCWLHQDWFVWPILVELNNEENFLSWLVAEEHEVKFGIPAGLGYQISLSVATAAVAFLTVWKAWPSDLERWAEAGGNRDRNRGRGGRNRGGRDRKPREGGRPRNGGQRYGSGSSSERSTGKSGTDSSDRPRRRRRGGRGRDGNSGQSQPRAGE